jgi:hypothetical protein
VHGCVLENSAKCGGANQANMSEKVVTVDVGSVLHILRSRGTSNVRHTRNEGFE